VRRICTPPATVALLVSQAVEPLVEVAGDAVRVVEQLAARLRLARTAVQGSLATRRAVDEAGTRYMENSRSMGTTMLSSSLHDQMPG
jgi:hypothetical protein